MFTSIDEKKGVVKTNWACVRKRVFSVEPTLASLIDELNPGDDFPLYLAYYPYGMTIADTETFYLPLADRRLRFSLKHPNIPKVLMDNLGYAINDCPLGIVLEKECEQLIDLPRQEITIPGLIHQPGSIVSYRRNLSRQSGRTYGANGVFHFVSGGRSVFSLASIGSAAQHAALQRTFNIKSPAPKTLYEHWSVFKEISESVVSQCDWKSCVLYFSEPWVANLHKSDAWIRLSRYIHEYAWSKTQYALYKIYYDFAFSLIQQSKNLKPNPYLADTAQHLFSIAAGASPGYLPASDDSNLPLSVLQTALVEVYGLKKYLPSIIQPSHFVFETDQVPIYYSLQYPSTLIFSPKSRKISSTLSELRELKHIMDFFISELSTKGVVCSDTVLNPIAKECHFSYFHNEEDPHGIVKKPQGLCDIDHRFLRVQERFKSPLAKVALDSPFLRGCVAIYRKKP